MLDSDSVKFRLRNEDSNSIKFSNVKVYALDVNTDTAGEQIAGEGCSDPQVTIEYLPDRTDYQTEGWVKISGLKAYGGNIYVTADEYRYNTKVNLQSGGEHTADFTITTSDAMGAISGEGQDGADSNMLSTYTKPATEGKTVHWMYSGASYKVSSSGEQAIKKVVVKYNTVPNNASTELTFDQKNPDGSITVNYPADNINYHYEYSTITVYFEPITTYEAQVYITASTVPVLNEYWLRSNSTEMAEISTYDGDTPSTKIFNNAAGAATVYQSKGIGCVSSAGDSDSIYKIPPGTTVKVRNKFVEESRPVSESLPQSLKDFVNRRFTFKGVKVYSASSFSHNSSGDAELGDELEVTKDGDYYVFTMPESGVRIVPEYDQHVRTLNVLSNQRDDNGNTYSIRTSTLGTATLTGDDDSWFIYPSWYDCDDRYDNTGSASHQWGPDRVLTLDGSRYTLTATRADSDGYVAKSVKAYKYPYSNIPQNNNIYQSSLYDSTYNWLTYDNEGNITNEEIPNVAGEFDDPDESGTRSCTITLPDNLDVGVVVLVVEFAPKDTTTFAHFKYEPDNASAKPFNPIVNFSGIFSGVNADYTSVTATEGADVETAVYDAQNAEYLSFEIGGNNKFGSAFYQYNLVYTIKDYTDDTVLAKFRVYRDQIYPIDCTEAQLNEYLVTSACTFEEVSSTSGVCEKATLRFKVPENGITLSYQSERLYIPVTVKQYVKNAADEYVPANSDLTATLTKYFESSTDISDFARNKFFAADSTLTSSTGLNAAGNSAFADTVTVTGEEKTYYMLIENASDWQGFYVQPSTARGYAVSSDGLSQISYSPLGNANSWDGYMTNESETYVEGSGYRVRYHAEYNYGMSYNNSDINSHMGGQRIEISIYYEITDDYYSSFSYNLNNSSVYTPKTQFKGTIQYDVDGVVDATNGNINLSVPAYDSESDDPKYLTMEVGGDSASNSAFHEANLVYTVTDKTTGAEVLKFRIYRGQVEPVGVYSQTDFDKYIASASVETYNSSQYDGLMEKASVQFKVPKTGLSVIFKCEPVYLPVTVKQYVLDSSGSASAAGNTFTSAVTKNPSGEDDFTRVKYFAEDNTLTDSYGLGSADQSEFVNNYTAAGASDTHFMYYRNYNDGLYIKPAPAEGYALATIQAKALNKNGDVISYNQSLTSIPTYNDAEKGYSISYSGNYYRYLQGAAIEVDVYYQPSTTLTVNQTIDGIISPSGLLASVTVTNANTAAPVSPYNAYVNPINNDLPADSFVIEDRASNMTTGENGGNVRSDAFTVNKGTKPQFAIKPEGSRTIASVTIYKKNGGEYQEVSADSYTFTESNGTQTYTFKNEYAIGDDYKVDIVFGVEKTLTVKAVMLNDNNSTNIVDTDAEFALTKATINVTGQCYDVNGNNTEDKAFVKDSQETNSFSVTNAPVSVTAYTNTNVTVQTNIEQSSKYVIANVVAVKENTNVDLHLVVPQSRKIDGKDVVTYETCTLPSLTSGDSNIEVLVYLARVADVKVSVYNVLSDGTIVDGVPRKDGNADGYVNVNVDSNGINQKAIITADDEGGYYTGDFDITFDPNKRTVKVIQGSNLNIFAQLPGNGQYVIRKVVCDGTGYKNIKVRDVSLYGGNLRETLDTNSTSIAAEGNYEIKIYIAEAKSIFTRVTNDNSGTGTYTSGSVTVRGNHSEDGVIPFTKISPVSSDAQRVNYYDAVTTSSSLDFTTEAKCIRDTALSFDVTPQTNYQIKSVSVKRGKTKEIASPIEYSSGSANSSGTITYTIADPMPFANGNIYIDVEFTLAQTGNVKIDFQYTDECFLQRAFGQYTEKRGNGHFVKSADCNGANGISVQP